MWLGLGYPGVPAPELLGSWEVVFFPQIAPPMLKSKILLTIPYLAGGLEHVLFFHHIGIFIIPTDELIFFRGVGQPPTSLQYRRKF